MPAYKGVVIKDLVESCNPERSTQSADQSSLGNASSRLMTGHAAGMMHSLIYSGIPEALSSSCAALLGIGSWSLQLRNFAHA